MDPRQFFFILRARYKVATVVLVLAVAGAMLANEVLPRRYAAETQVMVDIRSPDPAALLLPPTMIPGNLSTQMEIIRSNLVARKVVKSLGLDQSRSSREAWLNHTGGKGALEDWIASGLQRGLSVRPSRDSNVITIEFQGADPRFVADVANAFAQAYIDASIELKVEPARQYALWFGEQAKSLREQVERAQSRLSEFQQQKGIVATAESMDLELTKLSDLAAKVSAAQEETRAALSKQRPADGSVGALPEVRQDAVIVGLRSNIAQLEAKIKEAAVNLGTRHPQYLRMQTELAELQNRLAVEAKNVAAGYGVSGAVGRSKEVELAAAFEAQKRKVLAMKREHDEIAVLVRDVETAKRAYDAVTSRFNQSSLESQVTRTNVTVLAAAVEPLTPIFPKPFNTMLLLALAAGILAAGASVVALELMDRRVRSTADLEEMLQMPVLVEIQRARWPRLARARAPAGLLTK